MEKVWVIVRGNPKAYYIYRGESEDDKPFHFTDYKEAEKIAEERALAGQESFYIMELVTKVTYKSQTVIETCRPPEEEKESPDVNTRKVL
jgi:hypothetical protein